jgi:serine/threonine protein kinase
MTDDPHALRPGASIAGYNIVRVLGAGGFGITYEADSPFTGKRVAIKEFFPRGIASREGNTRIIYAERDMEVVQWALKRFESSTLDQCKLKHPNIVDVIHYVKDNGTGYMIMEYVEGQTLEHWLRGRATLPTPEELRVLAEPVLSALEYLHERRMIHRDIAPDNIMVRADGTPMIIDFGAIKLIEHETQIRTNEKSFLVAKQFYSPPEQIDAEGELDHRADIYAMAAALYRAFAGQPPVSAEARMQKLALGKPDPAKPLGAFAPHLPFNTAAAIDRALSFKAENRQQTVTELREALGWGDGTLSAPTLAISREKISNDPAARGSRLPWLLPLAGIAALAGYFIYAAGLITFPAKQEVVTPPQLPKMEQTEINEPKIFAPKEGESNQPPEDQQPQQQAPIGYAKWYTGEVQFYRAAPADNSEPLTSCVPGRRVPLIALVEDGKLRISQGGDTVFVDIGPDGNFRFESSGAPLARKMSYAGKITPETIEAEFVSSIDRGSCFGKLTAKATIRSQ